jgi:putative molybdopterin biosynthesis protein
MQVQNQLAGIRQKRGLSAAALAKQAGIQRQTIYAIEAGNYIPNTLVSLRLAQALEVTVEELFCLERPLSSPHLVPGIDLLSVGQLPRIGQPMRLCRVGKRTVGIPSQMVSETLPLADGVIAKTTGTRKAVVNALHPEEDSNKRLLVAGCDPAMSILGRHLMREAGIELVAAAGSSLQSLKWLKEKKVHIGGSHLRDQATGEPNLPIVKSYFPEGGYKVVTFAAWEEGLVVVKENPKKICGIADLSRKDLVLVNREKGAGSRFLLDELLQKHGIPSSSVCGYEQIAYGHIPAARHVHARQADCCIASHAAARVFGMDFIPLTTERYDLIIPDCFLDLRSVQILLDILNRSAFQRELEAVAGYDMSQTGKVMV